MNMAEQHTGILHDLHHEVMDIMEECLNTIDSSFSDNKDVEIRQALQLCAERTSLLGMSAATAGLVGMMDVCTLFSESLLHLVNREQGLANEERQQLEAWAPLLVAYLTNPDDVISAEVLIAYLQTIPWSSGMDDLDTTNLRTLLVPEEIERLCNSGFVVRRVRRNVEEARAEAPAAWTVLR